MELTPRCLALILGGLLAVSITACGDDDGDDDGTAGAGGSGASSSGGTGSGSVTTACTTPDGDGCVEFTSSSTAAEAVADACEEEDGTVSGACSTTDLSGLCTYSQGAGTFAIFYYGLDADEAEANADICMAVMNGTWSETP